MEEDKVEENEVKEDEVEEDKVAKLIVSLCFLLVQLTLCIIKTMLYDVLTTLLAVK